MPVTTSHSRQMRIWYDRAQIDYSQKYMCLYAAFNAWYQSQTRAATDREAINYLQKGNELWSEYCNGETMTEMISVMRAVMELTQREPLSHATPHWRGEVLHIHDWASLLEYWYRVRCLVMHGAEIKPEYVHLAYKSLAIFMQEAIKRTLN